jgi:serine/threonine protein kinase
MLAHYKIQERLGEGGMGIVYKAEDTELKRSVAIKALPPWVAGNQTARERLLAEARCASALNHPNIVTIYEILKEDAGDFIVMEYLSGRTLKDRIPPRGLPTAEAVRYALPIADALDYMHDARILHRDLKPSNIFILENGWVKLLDFSLAVPFGSSKARDGIADGFWGTSAYMAPEQRQGAGANPSSEVFSFGLVLWEMFTGRHPFRAHLQNDGTIGRPLGKRLPAKIPVILEPILRGCLEQELQKRFRSMREVNAALKDIYGSDPSVAVCWPIVRQSPRLRSGELQSMRAAIGRMNSGSLANSRQASEDLRRLLKTSDSEAVRSAVMSAMRDMILSVPRFRSGTVPPPIREIRKLGLELLRLASRNNLRLCLQPKDFEYLDLWNMNFSRLNLSGFSFERCFCVETSFEGCDLSHAVFRETSIRNVNFAGADLSGGDFTGADWFNAIGLTENQLRTIRPETLMECPGDEALLRDYLDTSYGFPLGSWSDQVREQILGAWKEYLRPGGVRDFVNNELGIRRK